MGANFVILNFYERKNYEWDKYTSAWCEFQAVGLTWTKSKMNIERNLNYQSIFLYHKCKLVSLFYLSRWLKFSYAKKCLNFFQLNCLFLLWMIFGACDFCSYGLNSNGALLWFANSSMLIAISDEAFWIGKDSVRVLAFQDKCRRSKIKKCVQITFSGLRVSTLNYKLIVAF